MSDIKSECTMEGTSSAPNMVFETEDSNESNEEMNGELTNTLKYTDSLLCGLNLLTNAPLSEISANSIAMEDAICEEIVQMLSGRQNITVDELIGVDEEDELNIFEPSVPDDDDYVAEEFKPEPPDYAHLWYEQQAVAIAAAHPKWSLKSLPAHGASRLESRQALYRWKEDVKRGGTRFDKWHTIDRETYERFRKARQDYEQVTTTTLEQWAMNSALPLLSEMFTFNASTRWVERFKQKHQIRQRKIKKFISCKEVATMEEVLAAAKECRIQTRIMIPDFDPDYIINTDQTGCQYQSTYDRTLAEKGSKIVLVKKKKT